MPVKCWAFSTVNVLIYLIAESSENKRKPGGSANLSFMVDEVDELYERCCAAGSEVLVKPGDRVYGQRDFAISDCDAQKVGFCVRFGIAGLIQTKIIQMSKTTDQSHLPHQKITVPLGQFKANQK